MFNWLFGKSSSNSPSDADWQDELSRICAHVHYLPTSKLQTFLAAAKEIVRGRSWVGCDDLVITDEIKITIAAQAALLLLGVEGYYFERVPSILVFPRQIQRRQSDLLRNGLFTPEITLLGEAWQGGSIVLSWPDCLAAGRRLSRGSNVVVHEFAHHLDGLDGEMGGTPPMRTRELAERWREVAKIEYEQLAEDVRLGRDTLLDSYGATNQAEFFAVASECFIESPRAMSELHPELYGLLAEFYQFDPSTWWPDAD